MMMAFGKYSVAVLIGSLLVFSACERDRFDVDTEKIEIPEIPVYRFEQDLFSISPENIEARTILMQQKYGVLFEHYLMNPLRLNGSADTAYRAEILRFVSDPDVRGAFRSSQQVYPDVNALASEIRTMCKRIRHHFPRKRLPKKIVTLTSGWNYAFAYMDSAFMISLDMYLGDTSRFYQMLRFPYYQTRKMNPAHILPDVARGWLLTEFDTMKPKNNLLNHTIFYGKLYFAAKALVPEVNDSLVIGYSAKQMETALQYERQYWSYFAEKNRLYENSLTNIRELTSEGPFTAAISRECPPRIAMWIGWRILQSYMKNNPGVDLEQMMLEPDAQKILSKSKYRP